MNEMSSIEDLLMGENYFARCQQLMNLITLLTNGHSQQQHQQQQQLLQQLLIQQLPQQLTTAAAATASTIIDSSQSPPSPQIHDHQSPMPNSVLQILQHLQDNQELQQPFQQQRQYRFQHQLQQQQQQQRSIQQQQLDTQLFEQQLPSITNQLHQQQQQQLQSRLCADSPATLTQSRHHHQYHQYQHNNHLHHQFGPNNNNNGNNNGTGGGPAAAAGASSSLPSSSLLAKLTAVTSRPSGQFSSTKLDQTMIDFLEAIYAINDNPEPAAIDMLSKRLNTTGEAISEWFNETRLSFNPSAGPRSPPPKKRQGGRVVTFSEYQRSLLEAIFDENNYLHPQEYEELSNLIQVPSRNIKIWFKNRRSKQRLSGRVNTPGSE